MRAVSSRQRRAPAAAALAAVTALLIAGGCGSLDAWQREAIFRVDPLQSRWHRDAPPGTEQFDLRHADGETVRAWYLPAADADAPTVLYLHGSRWNLHNSVFRFQLWQEMGFNMLAIDYRGFGSSSPRLPSEASAAEDVRLAFAELERRQPDPARRFVYGHSLGGALAIDLAADPSHAAGDRFAGLIVESSFTRIADLVRGSQWGWVPGIGWLITQPFDSAGKLPKVRSPLLLIHGTADGVVPPDMSRQLYAAAASVRGGLKELLLIDGGTHSGSVRSGGERYTEAVRRFMQRAAHGWPAATLGAAVGR
ncbi:MAG: alpha/beta hydrolase [Burkholderiaceae bacterium]